MRLVEGDKILVISSRYDDDDYTWRELKGKIVTVTVGSRGNQQGQFMHGATTFFIGNHMKFNKVGV